MAKRKPGKGPSVSLSEPKQKPVMKLTAGKGARAATGKSKSWIG